MVIVPFVRMGPLPRSLAAEAYDCFMVGVRIGPNRIQVCRAGKCAIWQAPLGSFAPTEQTMPDDSVCRCNRDQAAIRHHHQSADRSLECHGAHSGEGPVLAILAMLALKCALRVAAGGSAPPIPSVALRGRGAARSGRKSRFPVERKSWKGR
jgi:hypothetical protein